MHSELPPSSSDKWLHCHGWLRLHAPFRGEADEPSDAAAEGTLAHSLLEHILLSEGGVPELVEPLPPRPIVPEEMEERIQAVAEWVFDQPGRFYAEEMYDYGAQFGFSDLFGTADVTLIEDDRITVADLKYGFGLVEVERNPQLLIYLSAAVFRFGPREKYRLVILQPRGSHPDGPTREWELTHQELEEFNKILETAIARNYKGGKPTAGDHCRKYCRALATCPAAAKRAIQIFKENPFD